MPLSCEAFTGRRFHKVIIPILLADVLRAFMRLEWSAGAR